jgi:hypothetical protein
MTRRWVQPKERSPIKDRKLLFSTSILVFSTKKQGLESPSESRAQVTV